jgi:hypothetical protein
MIARLAAADVGRYGGTILAFGMALLAIIGSYRKFVEQRIGGTLAVLDSEIVFYIDIALIAVGGGLIILWLIAVCMQHVIFIFPRLLIIKVDRIKTKLEDLNLDQCNDADFVEITRLANDEFGDLAANLKRNRWLATIDPRAYTKVVDHRGRIVGFYDMFRLTKMGANAVHRGEFDITTCPREYLRGDKKLLYNNVYLAGLYGRNRSAKAMVLGAVSQRLLELRPKAVFARAGTKDGLRLIEQARFRPVLTERIGVGAFYVKAIKF